MEGWNYTDSFYFTGITVATIGYGDITPVTDVGKIFTVFFGFAGIGIALFVITSITEFYLEKQQRTLGGKLEKSFVQRIKNHRKAVTNVRRGIIRGRIGNVPIKRRKRT